MNDISPRPVPAVTVGMPVYNDARYLRIALDDLLQQSFTDFELVISDNASSDETPAICAEYMARDPRIRYVRQATNIGALGNFLFLFRQSQAEFFMWAPSDDRWDRDFIATLVAALRQDPGCSLAFCAFKYMDENETPIGTTQSFDFSGASVVSRIARLFLTFNQGADACWYGLYRRALIKDFRIRPWWSINAATPWGLAYPVLAYFLACGGYAHASSKPLWSNRLHMNSAPRYTVKVGKGVIMDTLAQLLRRINVAWYSLQEVHRGSKSAAAALFCSPVLAFRCIADIATDLFSLARSVVRYARKRLFPAAVR